MKVLIGVLSYFFLTSSANPLAKRGLEKCKNLQAGSNNGGRKVAIVIDESGSMLSADPYDLRVDAGKAVNDWLISSGEAGNGKAADKVAVIGFDGSSRTLYPLGDPGGADRAFDRITTLGDTFIAGGVDAGMSEITKSSDGVKDKSGIIVLTDGVDYDSATLVESINKAGEQGIRVSFGFLNTYGYSYQDPDVLIAVLGTGGMYANINGDIAQNAFVNVIIVHGLTNSDNPSAGNATDVYNGLSVAFILGSAGTSELTYTAEAGESLTFTISSVSAGDIRVTAVDAGGKDLGSVTTDALSSYSPEELVVKASTSGDLKLKIEGEPDLTDAMFIVGVNSSIPLTNCTLGESKDEGLTVGAKAGLGVGIPLLAGLLGVGSYFAWKYFKGLPPKTTPPAPQTYGADQPAMHDYKQPYMHVQDATPTPQPTNTHPGWAIPPAVPPPKFGQPPHNQSSHHPASQNSGPGQQQQLHNSHPSQPTHEFHHPQHQQSAPGQQQPFQNSHPSQPHYPTQADLYHPTQADPSHPTQADPTHQNQPGQSQPGQHQPGQSQPGQHQPGQSHPGQQQPFQNSHPSHPTQADPYHPTQADPSHPTQADPSHQHQPGQSQPGQGQPGQSGPSQADPYHPTQTDPSHQPGQSQPGQGQPGQSGPSQADPYHPQADPSHPTQADPSHPTQADPSHPCQPDPSHPTQADPSHPTQADPSHPTQADPSHPTQADPSHPTQADPHPQDPSNTDRNDNQPPQNPEEPYDPNDPHPKRIPTQPRVLPRLLGRKKKDDKEDQQQQQQHHHQYQQQHYTHNQTPGNASQLNQAPGHFQELPNNQAQPHELQGQYTHPQELSSQSSYTTTTYTQQQVQHSGSPGPQYGQPYSPPHAPTPPQQYAIPARFQAQLAPSSPRPGAASPVIQYTQPQQQPSELHAQDPVNRGGYNVSPLHDQRGGSNVGAVGSPSGSISRKPVGGGQ